MFYLDQKEISQIKADSFIVKEYPSGQIVFGNYFRKTGEIASLTKIMTFYTVYEIAERFNKYVST
jgi:D-alanyl-D-alanine carboxypeptidase